jgi:hypothetical protein
MQDCAAGAVDSPRIFTRQEPMVQSVGVSFLRRIHVRQALPSFSHANYVSSNFARAVNHRLDHRIQAGDVAASGQDPYILTRSHCFTAPLRA